MMGIFPSFKDLENQTPREKMHVLGMIARQMQGAQWVYFRKIKNADSGLRFFRERSLTEQMKATQAALKFTSRSVKNLYRVVYSNCLQDIRVHTGMRTDRFPKMPEASGELDSRGNPVTPGITDDHDGVIISWTPIKFLTTAKSIREKGRATQRHSEGVVAKLYFKVVGYYASGENWEPEKLTLYLRQLDEKSTYPDVASALGNLKQDMARLAGSYRIFKFGRKRPSQDSTPDDNVFDDTSNVESADDQVRTLYWHLFIYLGMELFLFRYFLILVTSTKSKEAIRQIMQIFEPALARAIEVKNMFLGSFETDSTKRPFRAPFRKYRRLKEREPTKKKLKTSQGLFETYNYTDKLLEKSGIGFDLSEMPEEQSEWSKFVCHHILNGVAYKIRNRAVTKETIPVECREYALMHLMNMMIVCMKFTKKAKYQILERFRMQVKKEWGIVKNREKGLRRRAAERIAQMEGKVKQMRRMKQDETADIYKLDIVRFKKRVELRCETTRDDVRFKLSLQRKQLWQLFSDLSKRDKRNEIDSPRYVLQLIDSMESNGSFTSSFTKRVGKIILADYQKELEPLYGKLFEILRPSTQEKVILIQSLEKSGGEDTVKLSLTKQEKVQMENMINLLKAKIRHGMPDIFDCKLVYLTTLIPIEDIFKFSIDSKSLQTLLRLKVVSPRNARPTALKDVIVKALTVLNLAINPVPKYNILQNGYDKPGDPKRAINGAELNRLLETVA